VIEGGVVVHEVRLPYPVAAVWEAITDPASVAAWLMPNDFKAVVGHRFQLDARPELGMVAGEVARVEPPHLLECRWTIDGAPTTVTIRLDAAGAHTVLHLEHAGLPSARRDGFDGGWESKFAHDLAAVLRRTRDPARATVRGDGLWHHADLSGE
jgi:uncharacterized protein YndB with AHSA1/START domain